MKTFQTLSEDVQIAQLEEEVGIALGKALLPKNILHLMKRIMHKKQYIEALKIAKTIMNDKSRDVSKAQALVKAAQVVGLDPRELNKVLNKNTRGK